MRLFWCKLLQKELKMRKGELTRARIIAQAAPIFNQQGFAGSSMQDVMAATGLEKGGLYRHFRSKEELAVESFRFALAKAEKLRTSNVETSDGAVEHLHSLVKHFVEAPSGVPGGCPLMNTAIDSDDGNHVLRALARRGLSDWKTRISRVVERGIRTGEIVRGTEPRRIANIIIATLEGALMMSRLEGTKTVLQDARAALDLLIEGIRVSDAKAIE